MASDQIAKWLLIGFIALAGIQAAYFYPQLPEQVAHHFGVSGHPDAWGSKSLLAVLNIGIVVLLGGVFWGIDALLPRLPDSMVNIPNREYWLAPERRTEAQQKLRGMMLWIGVLTLAFLQWIFYKVYRVNLAEPPVLSSIWTELIIYFIALGIVVWRFYRAFRLPG